MKHGNDGKTMRRRKWRDLLFKILRRRNSGFDSVLKWSWSWRKNSKKLIKNVPWRNWNISQRQWNLSRSFLIFSKNLGLKESNLCSKHGRVSLEYLILMIKESRWRRVYSSSLREKVDYLSLVCVRSMIWLIQLREELWCSWWIKQWVIIRDCFLDGFSLFEMKNNSRNFNKLGSLLKDSMISLVFKYLPLWNMTNKQQLKQRQSLSGYRMLRSSRGICLNDGESNLLWWI